jgi:hypothetical protein
MPEDIRWILQVTAPRIHAVNAAMYRQAELDDALFARSHALFIASLQGGTHLTRAELGAVLAEGGIVADTLRLTLIVMHAELEGLICSGAVRGKQQTYALLSERAPEAKLLDPDEALARLSLRYFQGHGPATVHDFAWWASLTLSQARQGLAMMNAELQQLEHDGQQYWFGAEAQPAGRQPLTAWLLPEYDEAIWFRSLAFPDVERTRDTSNWGDRFTRPIIIGGRRVGLWRRRIARTSIALEALFFAPLTVAEQAAFEATIKRYSVYMGLPVNVTQV